MRLRMLSSYFLSLAALSACGNMQDEVPSQPPAAEELGAEQQSIRNGDPVAAGYAEIAMITGPVGCSGVLVTNSLLLTAKHCIYGWVNYNEADPVNLNTVYTPSTYTVTLGS